MQEDFLHYLWKHKKFNVLELKTTSGDAVVIKSVGEHNLNSGPDFFNAQLKIDQQLWAGNVEIHIKSSDWFLHNHEIDKNYDNVILHVVWEHDTEIHRKDNTEIPTLELKAVISDTTLRNYQRLFSKKQKWINCENDFESVDDFVINNWLERLYFERLEQKSEIIEQLLEASKYNWEAVLFKMLAKNFGLKVNGEAFLSLANSFDFSVLRKLQTNTLSLEALFFGQADLLNDAIEEPYYKALQTEYRFLKQKFHLLSSSIPLQFFRLRPLNFPTIRLSQLTGLYHKHLNIFSRLIETENIRDMYDLLYVSASAFWDTHYTFGKTSKFSKKTLTKDFINLLLINTIIPIKFTYARHHGKIIDNELVGLIEEIPLETNSIVTKFDTLKPIKKTAMHSQALLELKNNYCDKNNCLQCEIGNTLLSRIV